NSIGSNFIDNDRESFYRDDEGVRFGYLGRLDSAKGIENIIDYLKTVDLNFTLMIAGKGNASFVEKLKRKCSQDPRFIFIGQTEISIFFKKIDCLICPSIWNEPMGRVVIESFSYGIPVIGNNVGGIGELINSGKTGF
ncbi:TPA: glycosyltransferase, partial [Klebsiella pneumoniae]|nr:glycosyltransferase [Klebsiella pneumoniae]